jgi:putative peptidoglycan lipid II flippase
MGSTTHNPNIGVFFTFDSEVPGLSKPKSITAIATIVAIATLLSKLAGLVRQVALAAAFGTQPVIDAYNYAYVIPGFLLILLGGINGPFHSAIVSALAKREQRDAGPLVETITTLISLILIGLCVLLFFFADPLINLTAAGLNDTTHQLAVQQLRIMTPMALLAGLIGIGYGTLSSADMYWLPSISPLLSSITVVLGIGWLWLTLGKDLLNPEHAVLGGAVLAGSTLAGAVLQWLVQIPPQWKAGLGTLRPRFDFKRDGVAEVMKVLGPATFSSGTLQINVWVDLFFTSSIAGAAASMGYANLLVQTPLGILSSMLLVPMLPVFARLAAPENWPELKGRIRQAMMLTALSMLPLGALMIGLANPIVKLVYERGAFNAQSVTMTTGLLMSYSFGMFVYLGRDMMVRVFYALGDGDTPFRLSLINILLNVFFDWFFAKVLGWDAPGIVLSTVMVNFISLVVFWLILNRRLRGLPSRALGFSILGVGLASIGGGFAGAFTSVGLQSFWSAAGLIPQAIQLALSGIVGVSAFMLLTWPMQLPEMRTLTRKITQRLPFFKT